MNSSHHISKEKEFILSDAKINYKGKVNKPIGISLKSISGSGQITERPTKV